MNSYRELYERLKTFPMKKEEFLNHACNVSGLYADRESELEILRACGFPIREACGEITLATAFEDWHDQTFCFTDIETTGSNPQKSSVIEIGAIKCKNGRIIGKFETFVHAKDIPEKIVELTGISDADVSDSPKVGDVMARFREFLGDGVFVGHNVNFDYDFIGHCMEEAGLNKILNPKLCTIDLSRRTILSKKYSLAFLNDFLGINTPVSHRAYADALSSLKVFEICLHSLPAWVKSTQDLLDFSKGKSVKQA